MPLFQGKAKRVKVSTLKPMPGNHRKHDERQIKLIRESLRTVGQARPLLVNKELEYHKTGEVFKNVVIAGNGLLEAMKREGWEECDVLLYDMPTVEAVAASIKDNRAAELGDDDIAEYAAAMRYLEVSGYDTEDAGFYFEERQSLYDLADKESGAGEKEEKKEVKGEVEFTAELYEAQEYLVLTFSDSLTFQAACEEFGVKSIHAKGSKPGTNYELVGKSRVLDGGGVLRKLQEARR